MKPMNLKRMHPLRHRVLMSLAAFALAASAQAGSLVASSADAGVEGSRGSSNSSKLSSDSSDDNQMAAIEDGTYRITQIEDAANGEALRLTLTPGNRPQAAQTVQLEMPRQAFGVAQPRVGEQLQAQRRSHGVRFAREDAGEAGEPFYLLLADAVLPELDARPLTP